MRFSKLVIACVLATFATTSLCSVAMAQNSDPTRGCSGLHAGVSVQLTTGYTEPSVMVAFLLLNDSATDRKTDPGSWTLVIDGHELNDSGMLFGNGPVTEMMASGMLRTGDSQQFAKALPIAKYFPEHREYRVSWKGRDFMSPTVTIKVP